MNKQENGVGKSVTNNLPEAYKQNAVNHGLMKHIDNQ